MRELFIDASRGLAGDMLSAALLQLFDHPEDQIDRLNAIGIPGICYRLEPASSYSVTGAHLHVTYLEQEEGVERVQTHRSIDEISAVVRLLYLSDAIKDRVYAVYRRIAEAESKVHGKPVELVHFHELGAMDAVADICAAVYLVDALRVRRVTVSPVCTGFGSVRAAHGLMPVPAPATALLLRGIPCFAGSIEGELCTPTGAALAGFLADSFAQMPPIVPISEAYGLGGKDFGALSCVRTVLGETQESILELCCNVDDMSPEAVGFALDVLLRAGAPDAWCEPIGMKKNRPGLLLSCLCREDQREKMLQLIFKHTTTIGIRETICRRFVLKRHEEISETPYGPVRIKWSAGDGVERRKAEFDDLARIARDQNMSLREVEELLYDDAGKI